MKAILFILFFLLPNIFGNGFFAPSEETLKGEDCVLLATPTERPEVIDFKDACITTARSSNFSGKEDTFSPTVRRVQSTHRTQQNNTSSSRIIRCGKVVDKTFPFILRQNLQRFATGTHDTSRYIHLIRCLII